MANCKRIIAVAIKDLSLVLFVSVLVNSMVQIYGYFLKYDFNISDKDL